jgi:hypothetical protein
VSQAPREIRGRVRISRQLGRSKQKVVAGRPTELVEQAVRAVLGQMETVMAGPEVESGVLYLPVAGAVREALTV